MIRIFFAIALLLAGEISVYAQNLPRSSPEEQGVKSKNIIDFLDAVNSSKHEFHSFVFVRHGKVIAEGWWNPYRSDLKHTLYSVSKSFTSTAIGFAVQEGKLKVTDKVISFFPKDLPDTVSENLRQLTVKELLTQTIGWDPAPNVTREDSYAKPLLASYFKHKPGTRYYYDSEGSFLLAAIIKKITGQNVIDYLKPRLFVPLGIFGMDWESNPEGINQGGWGLRLKTEDMAKFGQLYLQNGKWNGKQLLPAAWIKEATSMQVDLPPQWTQPGSIKDSNDWMQGYGYLFWRCRNNAFRADGAMGQYIIVMPDQDAVIAITSESGDMQGEMNLIWKHLFPAMENGKLTADRINADQLRKKLSSLSLPLPVSQETGNVGKKSFEMIPNELRITSVAFEPGDKKLELRLVLDTAVFDLKFGSGAWVEQETTMRPPARTEHVKGNLLNIPSFKVAAAYRFINKNTLELTLRFIESTHSQRIICTFENGGVMMEFISSFGKRVVIKSKT